MHKGVNNFVAAVVDLGVIKTYWQLEFLCLLSSLIECSVGEMCLHHREWLGESTKTAWGVAKLRWRAGRFMLPWCCPKRLVPQ